MLSTEQRIAQLERDVSTLIEIQGAHMVVLGTIISAIARKGLMTKTELSREFIAALAGLRPEQQGGIPGQVLEDLLKYLSSQS